MKFVKYLLLLTLTLCLTQTALASPLTGDAGVEHWVVLMIGAAVLLIAMVVVMIVQKKKNK